MGSWSPFQVPLLDGPEDFHVCLAHSETDKDQDFLESIKRSLETATFRCLDPQIFYSIDVDELTKIENAVMRCRKVLIFITKTFLEKGGIKLICSTSQRKANERNDSGLVLLIIQDDVKEEEIPSECKEYSRLAVGNEHFDEDLCKMLAIESARVMAVLPVAGIAKGLAWSYFYGYLAMVLPDLPERYRNFAKKEWKENPADRVMPWKMFIVLPASCYCPTSLDKIDGKFKEYEKKIPYSASRAGCQNRSYSSTVYSVVDDQDKTYYVQIEFATPVLSMWEMYAGELAGMREQEKDYQLRLFHDLLKRILSHSNNKAYHDKAVFLYYDDIDAKDGALSTMVLQRIKLEIQRDMQNGTIEQDGATNGPTTLSTVGKVTYLKCSETYEEDHSGQILPRYRLHPTTNCRYIGKALIISIEDFDPNSGLKKRRGGEHDRNAMLDLWKKLGFFPELVTNPTRKGIISTVSRVAAEDHSMYQAFVCCILTHGDLGVLYGCDGKEVKITSITHLLTPDVCESLADKPKMFFIQACLGRREEGNDCKQDGVDGLCALDISTDKASRGNQSSSGNAVARYTARLVPGAKDFIMSYATLPGAVSYREIQCGSFYIDSLADSISLYRNKPGMDLERILKKVSECVEDKSRYHVGEKRIETEQFPFCLTTTNKLLYLTDSQY